MARKTTQVTAVALTGGLNLAAAPLAMEPGEALVLHNYTHDTLGRYERVEGFVRFDGHPDPVTQNFIVLRVAHEHADALLVGARIMGNTSGADGTVAHVGEGEVVLIDVRGQFKKGEFFSSDDGLVEVLGEMANASLQHVEHTQEYRREIQKHYRQFIHPVPGIGPIRGVAQFFGKVYAWRDNLDETETIMWGSSPDGWVKVPVTAPRVYSPPYPYDYLIYAGAAGHKGTFKCGYFRRAPWYGEILLPIEAAEAQRVVDISFEYVGELIARITFDPGVPLGDVWGMQIYVEDILVYKFDQDLITLVNPDSGHTAYYIDVPVPPFRDDLDPDETDPRLLWAPRQKVGIRFIPMTDKPGPETDVWALSSPAEAEEGKVLSIEFTCSRADGMPGAGRICTWVAGGITVEDLNTGAVEGSGTTDSDGKLVIPFDLFAEGLTENDVLRFIITTPAKNEYTCEVKIIDALGSADTHTYEISGPVQGHLGDPILHVVSVIAHEGQPVPNQKLKWHIEGLTAADTDSDLAGEVFTSPTGQAFITTTVFPTSMVKSFTFKLDEPKVAEMTTALIPAVLPEGVVPGPVPDGNGIYYAIRLSRAWVAPEAPVLITIYTFKNREGVRAANVDFAFTRIQPVKPDSPYSGGRAPKFTTVETKNLTSDENGVAVTHVDVTPSQVRRVVYSYAFFNGARVYTLFATYIPTYRLHAGSGPSVGLGGLNTRMSASKPNPPSFTGAQSPNPDTSQWDEPDNPDGIIWEWVEDAPPPAVPLWRATPELAADLPRSDLGMYQRARAWLPGGKFKTKVANFSGGTSVGLEGINLYGVDGVNPSWVFDGVAVQFIETGMALSGFIDRPNCLAILPIQALLLGYKAGTLLISSIGNPGEFEVAAGAAEIAVSDKIVDIAVQPNEVVAIFCESTVKMLTGKSLEEMQLSVYSERLSITPWSLQPLGDSIFLTDDGITRLSRVQEFGDFRDTPLTAKIKPLLDRLKRDILCSWVVATRNEYRILFKNGLGIIIKFTGSEVMGISTFGYGEKFNIVNSAEAPGGQEEIYAGALDDGFVYRLEHGNNFDGAPIESINSLAYHFTGSVEDRKRFKKIQLEVDTPESVRFMVRAELDYASPEAPALYPHEVMQSGGSGFYDMSYFREVLWSGERFGIGDVYIQGVGRNISVVVYSKTDKEPPHVLSSLILHWSPRGRRR